jgi:hypothetical protein
MLSCKHLSGMPVFLCLLLVSGCQQKPQDPLHSVRRAALKIEAYTQTGVSQMQMSELLGDMNAELLYAKDATLAAEDLKRLGAYAEILDIYAGSMAFRDAKREMVDCIVNDRGAAYCESKHGAAITAAAARAKVSKDLSGQEGMLTSWQVASQKLANLKRP